MALGTRLGENLPDDGSGIGDEGANHQEVPVMDGANLDDFIELFRNKSHPVVLKNVASNWPLFEKWTPEFFAEQFPDDPVILFDAAVENSKLAYTEGKETKSTSLKAFIQSMRQGSKDYARLLPLLDQHPELLDDMDVKWLHTAANNGRKKASNINFSSAAQGHPHPCIVPSVPTCSSKSTAENNGGFIPTKKRRCLNPSWTAPCFSEATPTVRIRKAFSKKRGGGRSF